MATAVCNNLTEGSPCCTDTATIECRPCWFAAAVKANHVQPATSDQLTPEQLMTIDDIEVGNCWFLNAENQPTTDLSADVIAERIDDEGLATFWSVFGHLRTGGVGCLADFATEEEAEAFADKLYGQLNGPVFTITGSHGALAVNAQGDIISTVPEEYGNITCFDLKELHDWRTSISTALTPVIDILEVGYWYGTRGYEAAEPDVRKAVLQARSGPSLVAGECAGTNAR